MKFLTHKTNKNVILLDYEMHEDNYAGTLIQKNDPESPYRIGEYREDWSKEDWSFVGEPMTVLLFNVDLSENEGCDALNNMLI